jgi:hypothetical protein
MLAQSAMNGATLEKETVQILLPDRYQAIRWIESQWEMGRNVSWAVIKPLRKNGSLVFVHASISQLILGDYPTVEDLLSGFGESWH